MHWNNETGLLNKQYQDSDMCKEARKERYQEFCGLAHLPFMVDEQLTRLRELEKLRIRDNRYAFNNDKHL